ncbi:MAG: FAD-binding protein [Deltaproteobacteria bacterium]|nr:FAD-binding protein [Deltaproteobacteria bacterium]
MIDATTLKTLSGIVGTRYLISRQEDLTEFGSDATKLTAMPEAVAFPSNGEDISRILQLANRAHFPVIPRGAGSGKSGGAVPVEGGLVLALDRLNRIIRIDEDNLIAKVEPGVITAHFQKAVEEVDLFYPPDPASIDISTIGGNVAECAGGLRAVKYGVTRDYVLGLMVVLPTGEIIKTGVETAKGVVGYDLTRLIVGSEGTLAVITEITLRLIPKPLTTKTMIAFFQDAAASVRTVSNIIKHKIVPTAMEFMDRHCIDCVKEEIDVPIPADAGALLIIEVDGDEVVTNQASRAIQGVCGQSGAIRFQMGKGHAEAERLWEIRRYVSESIMKLAPHKVSEDIVVPRNLMADLVSFLGRLGAEYRLPIPAFGHAGDGNIHVNILFDREAPGAVEKVDRVVEALFKKVLELGGTISGEHGVGVTKAPYLGMEVSKPAVELMRRLKRAFDPRNILNPGKIFPV